jgi:hypothetical protein
MNKKFDLSTVPSNFAHCTNSQCLREKHCLRRLTIGYIPPSRAVYTILNPEATKPDGSNCTFFIDKEPQLYAVGITHLLEALPYAIATTVKGQLIQHFGKTAYYRYQRKEKGLSPKNQEYIRRLLLKHGITSPLQFDEYVEYYELNPR